MKKTSLIFVAALGIAAVIGGLTLSLATPPEKVGFAMTELKVSNLTCGSCAANIRNALAAVEGIQSVEVNVTAGRGQVVFDPAAVAADRIAQLVTAAGYPAAVTKQLSAEQYLSLRSEDARLAKLYVARVGDTLLGREDFEQLVSQQLTASGLQNQPAARNQVLPQAWKILLQRTLMLIAAERNQVVIQAGEVDLRIQQLRQQQPDFDSKIETRFGSFAAFSRRLKEDLTIQRTIDQHVLVGVDDPQQRQAEFSRWYQQLIESNPVLFYDPDLKQAAAVRSGCGGGCCNKS